MPVSTDTVVVPPRCLQGLRLLVLWGVGVWGFGLGTKLSR